MKKLALTILTVSTMLPAVAAAAVSVAPGAATALPASSVSFSSGQMAAGPTPPPSPTISPSVRSVANPAGSSFPACPTGVLCARVRDVAGGGSRVFFLANCHTYTLSHWYDVGDLIDNQTGGVTTYLYNQQHQVINHFKPVHNHVRGQAWDSVYYIKNC